FNADTFVLSASDLIISDLKQEIVNGSTSPAPTPASGVTLYFPSSPANMLPARNAPTGTPDPIPNLVRTTSSSLPVPAPGISTRASALSSAPATAATAASKGQISWARWNKHYLIPQANPGTPTDTTPVTTFVPPDWVFVTDQGPQTITTPSTSVLGRYTFA